MTTTLLDEARQHYDRLWFLQRWWLRQGQLIKSGQTKDGVDLFLFWCTECQQPRVSRKNGFPGHNERVTCTQGPKGTHVHMI